MRRLPLVGLLILALVGSAWAQSGGGGGVRPTGAPTNHQVPVWTNGTTIKGVTPGTAGRVLTSNGTGSDPSFQIQATPGLNVKDYGAVGDGSTDDTTAIAAAITAAGLVHGYIFFPPGTYAHTGLNLLSNGGIVPVKGSGAFGTSLKSTSAAVALTAGDASAYFNHLVIEDIQLDGNSTGTVGALLTGMVNWDINRVWVHNFITAGIRTRGTLVGSIRNGRIYTNVIGVDMDHQAITGIGDVPANSIAIIDTQISTNTAWGVKLGNHNQIHIINGDIENNGTSGTAASGGVYSVNAGFGGIIGPGLTIEKVWFEDNHGGASIYIDTTADAASYTVIDSVSDVVNASARTNGLYVEGATRGNIVYLRNSRITAATTADIRLNGTGGLLYTWNSAATTTSFATGSTVNAFPRMDGTAINDFISKIGNYANAAPTNGQILIGKTSTGTFEAATITAGTGMTVTNGAGVITLASSGGFTDTKTISGLIVTKHAAANTLDITAGEAYNTAGTSVVVCTAQSGISAGSLGASQWNQVYVYDSGGGTCAFEVVNNADPPTTAYKGTARQGGTNSNRRWIGAFRTNGSSNIIDTQVLEKAANEVMVTYFAAIQVLTSGTASSLTAQSLITAIPRYVGTTALAQLGMFLAGGTAAGDQVEMDLSIDGTNIMLAVTSVQAIVATTVWSVYSLPISPSTPQVWYDVQKFASGTGPSGHIWISGYAFAR